MNRRKFVRTGTAPCVLSTMSPTTAQEVPTHNWDKYDFGAGPKVSDRLNQGPFGIEQNQGWYTVQLSIVFVLPQLLKWYH